MVDGGGYHLYKVKCGRCGRYVLNVDSYLSYGVFYCRDKEGCKRVMLENLRRKNGRRIKK